LADARRVLRRARYYTPSARSLWELSLKAAENVNEEEEIYGRLLKLFPGDGGYVVALGASRIERGDYAGAAAVLEPLTKEKASAWSGAAHLHLARSAFRQRDPGKALKHLESAAATNPESVSSGFALQFKGQILEQLGQAKEAIAVYRLALQGEALAVPLRTTAAGGPRKVQDDEGDPIDLLAALVRLSLVLHQRPEAMDYLRQYTLAVDEDPAGLLAAADFHLQLGRYEDAHDLVSRAKGKQSTPDAQRILGLIKVRQGNLVEAIAHLEKAGDGAAVLEALLSSYLQLGKLSDAEERLKRLPAALAIKSLCPICDRVTALGRRRNELLKEVQAASEQAAACARAAGRLACAEAVWADSADAEQAQRLLAEVFAEHVDLGPAFALRGLLALEKGKLTRGWSDAERAIALSPRSARAYYVRGRIRLERGDKTALADLEKAAALSGRQDAAVLHWLASALFRDGRPEAALATQREAIKLKPDNQEYRELLRDLQRAAKVERPAARSTP
jgi:tetratricopeptide (TPR) repeat protein